MKTLPRGIRNNNPGNIERNLIVWEGMSADQSGDSRFVVFDAPVWGIRALARVLLNYYRRHGLRTVAEIIGRWAPVGENDTGAYAELIAEALQIQATTRVRLEDPALLSVIVAAIILHENGVQPYSLPILQRGLNLAFTAAKF
jgi:hypothetical protein